MFSDRLKKLFQLAQKANLQDDKQIQTALKVLSVVWDEDLAKDIEQIIMIKGYQSLKDPFHPYPKLKGEIKIGHSNGNWFGLQRKEINQNILVVGRSGSGKTNLFYSLIKQYIDNNIPFWAVDFKKDYRHLIKEYPEILVIPWTSFKFNPLKPPHGIKPTIWAQTLTEVFCHANALLAGSKNFLLDNIIDLYKMYGVFEGKNNYPSFIELSQKLESIKFSLASREASYLQVIKNRVRATIHTIGNILDCEKGFPIEKLLERNVVIELDGLMDDMQNFLLEVLLTWVYTYRVSRGKRNILQHGIFFDEAKRVFDVNKERSPASGIPIIDIITDRAREFGESLIVADQEPIKLTDSIKANTYTKIMLSLGSGKDIAEISKCMGLNSEQMREAYSLSVGQALIKIAGIRPFPLTIPYVPIEKTVTDKEVNDRIRKIESEFIVKPRIKNKQFQEQMQNPQGISKNAERLLIHINKDPFLPISKRYKFLNISVNTGNKAKQEIIRNGLVKEKEIRQGKGGRPKVFQLTRKGIEYLTKRGHTVEIKEKGGIEHRFWQAKAKEYFENLGCKVLVEQHIGKRSIDLFVRFPDNRIVAVEIATHPEHQLENILKDLELGFDEIIVACKNENVKRRIEKTVKGVFKEVPQKIRFCLVDLFNALGE